MHIRIVFFGTHRSCIHFAPKGLQSLTSVATFGERPSPRMHWSSPREQNCHLLSRAYCAYCRSRRKKWGLKHQPKQAILSSKNCCLHSTWLHILSKTFAMVLSRRMHCSSLLSSMHFESAQAPAFSFPPVIQLSGSYLGAFAFRIHWD